MTLIGSASPARVRAIGIDTILAMSDALLAQLAAVAPETEYVGRYVDSLTSEEIARIHAAGKAILPFTYANEFDPAPRLAKLAALGCPPGVTIMLDVEGVKLPADQTIARIDAWALAMKGAQRDPGAYVGAGAGLTAAQWTGLAVDRYMRSCSAVPEPSEGFCVLQLYRPNVDLGRGLVIDWQVVQQDYRGRVPVLWTA